MAFAAVTYPGVQLNVRVPDAAPSGDTVPIVLNVGSVASQSRDHRNPLTCACYPIEAGTMPAAHPDRVRFEGSQPILRVENMPAALRFYVDALGFENAPWGTQDFTSVARDRAAIYLCRGDQGRGGAWVWVGVEDAQKLHDEWKARGVPIREGLKNYPWALEFRVEDPDGNVIRFGSEPLS